MFLAGEFKEAYPNAKLYAVEEVAHDKVDFKDMKFDGGKHVQLPFFKVHTKIFLFHSMGCGWPRFV
jgi:hypothetical protein